MTVTAPTSLADALAALDDDPESLVLAGGTDLMVQVNEGLRTPGSILALSAVDELREVQREGDELVLGAGLTYTDLMGDAVAAWVPALAGGPNRWLAPDPQRGHDRRQPRDRIPRRRHAPGVGGLGRFGGHRQQVCVLWTEPIGEFLTGPKATSLGPGELIVSVRVPVQRGPQEYLKVGVRNAMVIAVASVAMVVDRDAGTVGVGLGSVGPTALPARDACGWLASQADWRDDAVADEFASRVADAARPIDDHRGRASYRKHAVGVMARRALRRCAT